jgi:hypothetical protein
MGFFDPTETSRQIVALDSHKKLSFYFTFGELAGIIDPQNGYY